jgi:hypothetical protein
MESNSTAPFELLLHLLLRPQSSVITVTSVRSTLRSRHRSRRRRRRRRRNVFRDRNMSKAIEGAD